MERYTRKRHRLLDYDYGSYGYYFVTLCVKNKDCLLGTVRGTADDGRPSAQFVQDVTVHLTPLGETVKTSWLRIEKLNKNVKLDIFVIMPNHIHGIIILENDDLLLDESKPFGFGVREPSDRRTLHGLIKDFKSVTTRLYQRQYGGQGSLWQASFYDEIIRSQAQYDGIWRYIDDNPRKWHNDRYYG